MPCSDSSSSLVMRLDPDEVFISFDFAKITCGREITSNTGYADYCKDRDLNEIFDLPYVQVAEELGIEDEESQFILYLEWDCLRTVIAEYLGINDPQVDRDRCIISSIEHEPDGVEVALVVLPPKEMPKILPCSLGDDREPQYEKAVNEEGGEEAY